MDKPVVHNTCEHVIVFFHTWDRKRVYACCKCRTKIEIPLTFHLSHPEEDLKNILIMTFGPIPYFEKEQ